MIITMDYFLFNTIVKCLLGKLFERFKQIVNSFENYKWKSSPPPSSSLSLFFWTNYLPGNVI